MKANNILVFFAALVIISTGCSKKFDSLEQDPNRPKTVPPSLALNGVLNDINPGAWNQVNRWNQFSASNYAYYDDQEYNWTGVSFSPFSTVKNIIKMEEEALLSGAETLNPYTALGKFFRAYLFYDLTMKVGDLPMTEALKGLDNLTPVYNTQKEVFQQILVWLEESNNDLSQLITSPDLSNTSEGQVLKGDFYFKNDLSKWQKTVNAFHLRVLIQLSKKEADADLSVKTKFAQVVTDNSKYPLFSGMDDNLQYVYNNQFNKYPTNPDNYGFDATRYNTSATYLNTLVQLKDPRTFVTAEPAAKKVAGGVSPTSFEAFIGASSGEDLADMSSKAGNGEYSFINRYRYYRTYTAENTIIVGYPEMCFNIAEAINRGWVSGEAEEWYKKGVEASISFYGISDGSNTVFFQKAGGGILNTSDYNNYIINFNFDTYYAQPSVMYAGDTKGLNQILTQKYLAFFQNSGWEAYYNWRRTGVPEFLTGPGTGNSQRIAKRFQYPTSETATNADNLNAAVQRQFSGSDDINADIWIIK